MAQKMKKLLGLLRSSNSSRQSQLFQFFLASKMAQPVGLRRTCSHDNNEEIDLELDEDDMTSSEVVSLNLGVSILFSLRIVFFRVN
ncbi:unnamed protein product [Schistosoma margrebowiei]|uniref:Uncharacterized protein n=1 Tax=Schistosoma margrebowiei TaxID=48269 RepID=A0A3P8BHJ3_9TREM|nr:unnamed protein product [Schistosoma margrebowiei]